MKYSSVVRNFYGFRSRPARGGWVEIKDRNVPQITRFKSRPARGGWVEMRYDDGFVQPMYPVPPRKGRVG